MASTINGNNRRDQTQSQSSLHTMMHFDVPGAMNKAIPQLLEWAINSYAPLMLVLGALAAARSYIYQFLALLENHFTTELHVRPSDPPYDMLMAWVYCQGLNKSARSRIVRVDDRGPNMLSDCDKEEKPIWFAPWNGSFLFWFRRSLLSYRSYTTTTAFRDEEHIIIKCIGRSGTILDELIEECRQEYSQQNKNMTTVFEHRGEYWQRKATKHLRPLSSVIIPEKMKQNLVDDLMKFRDADNLAKYRMRDIPYRRGYLLYGPPGTGKSSLTSAIAGHCGLDIYIVDVPCVNDRQLKELFNKLPRRCIVLLEDIDAVGADRDEDSDEHQKRGHSLSLSGLLNTLDGVAAQQGRLLIMTTNHEEQLDPALIRPGRIDLKLELKYADSKLTTNLFEFMYKPVGEAEPLSKAKTVEIERAAREFAAIVPENEFSVAQIMSYIQQNWESPTVALQSCRKWVTQALKEKEDRRREDNYAGTVGSLPSTPREAAEEGELEWLWERNDALIDVPRTRNCRDLPAAACITPLPSPSESYHHHEASKEDCPFLSNASPRLPVQGIGNFGWPLASTFPASWLSDGIDDCCTDVSDASSDGLFLVPPKRLSANVPRITSYDFCPGLVTPSQTSLAETDTFDSPASAGRVVSSGWHDEEIGRKVREWCYRSDCLTASVGDSSPVDDTADGANHRS